MTTKPMQAACALSRERFAVLLRLDATVDRGDIFSLQAVEDVMWCFAATFVRRFDGRRWERFDKVL